MKKPTLIKPDGSPAETMSPAQIECIKLLSDALETAKNGGMFACVIVAVGPEDFGIGIGGSDAPRLHLGLGVAMREVENRTSPPSGGQRTVLHRAVTNRDLRR